ncbi:MAG TPA: hypothetical protein VLS90_12445 [Thermodesulfobacteriota bacterium]|nr:hypothetical protein [Thermodesulfobacteriota bacterium]
METLLRQEALEATEAVRPAAAEETSPATAGSRLLMLLGAQEISFLEAELDSWDAEGEEALAA